VHGTTVCRWTATPGWQPEGTGGAVAANIQRRCGGRSECRLGSQTCQNMVQRYSIPEAASTTRLRGYIESLRALCATFQHGVESG